MSRNYNSHTFVLVVVPTNIKSIMSADFSKMEKKTVNKNSYITIWTKVFHEETF